MEMSYIFLGSVGDRGCGKHKDGTIPVSDGWNQEKVQVANYFLTSGLQIRMSARRSSNNKKTRPVKSGFKNPENLSREGSGGGIVYYNIQMCYR